MDHFSLMPVEIFMDDRLSKTDLRVLGSIMSWRNKSTNLCHPSREQISERCGLSVHKISTATSRLVKLGWLEKSGNGGRSMRCVYKFKVPDLTESDPKTVVDSGTVNNHKTVLDSGTVPDLETVPESAPKTVPDSGTKTVPDLGTGNKLKDNLNITKNIYIEKKPLSNKKNEPSIQNLVPNDLWEDFLEVRIKHKNPANNSPIAIKRLISQLQKLKDEGHDPTEVVNNSILHNWKSVYPIKNKSSPSSSVDNREHFNKQQTAIAKQKLFGDISTKEKDITDEARTL